ncbi:MAG: exodeoxyribonuclease III [Candidatus Gracilibacteria bacterium]|jgi:exodeoxyribonuclease-3|nr:exodeoxyribonuclease III [Candidatus Gracilibacteria bacterium]
MKITSWNINGLRAIHKKGFVDFLNQDKSDIYCLQEVKAQKDQIQKIIQELAPYHFYLNSAEKKGYSGVAILSKEKPLEIKTKFPDILNYEGRIIEAHFKDFVLLNIYFPNGGKRANGDDMLGFKLNFYDKLINYLKDFKKDIIIAGDFNIAHTEIDIKRAKENKNSIGFLPIERDKLTHFLNHGYIDAFRFLNPEARDVYSWWSYRANARANNVGWRIDYFFTSISMQSKLKSCTHQTDIIGSDHCPISLEF